MNKNRVLRGGLGKATVNIYVVQLLSCVWLFATSWLPCPSLSPGVCSNSCPLGWWHHPTISSCRPLLLLPSIFPSFRVFSVSQLFASGGQRNRGSISALVLSVNILGWFPLRNDWFDLLAVQGALKIPLKRISMYHYYYYFYYKQMVTLLLMS